MSLNVEPAALEQYLKEYAPHEMAQVPQAHVKRCCEGMNAALQVLDKGRGR